MLDRFVFECVNFPPFVVTAGCVMAKAYVCPRVSDDLIMYVLVKGGLIEFMGLGETNN